MAERSVHEPPSHRAIRGGGWPGTVASNALDGQGGGEVKWFLEPAEVRWIFRPSAEGLATWVERERARERCVAVGHARRRDVDGASRPR